MWGGGVALLRLTSNSGAQGNILALFHKSILLFKKNETKPKAHCGKDVKNELDVVSLETRLQQKKST